jgi:hypothetical protein
MIREPNSIFKNTPDQNPNQNAKWYEKVSNFFSKEEIDNLAGMDINEAILHMKYNKLIPESINQQDLEIFFLGNIPVFTLISECQIEETIPLNTHRTGFNQLGESYIFRFVKLSEKNKFGGIGHEFIHVLMRNLRDKMPYSQIEDKMQQSRIRSFIEEIFCYSFNQVTKDGTRNNFGIVTPNFVLNNFFYIIDNQENLKINQYKTISQKLSALLNVCGKDTKGYLLVRLKQIRKYCSSLEEIEEFLDKEINFTTFYFLNK